MSLAQNHYVIQLPKTPAPVGQLEPRAIAQRWITDLESLLSAGNFSQLPALFHEDSWWRDMLALVWDLRTIQGREKIQEFLAAHQPGAGISALRLQNEGKYQPNLESPAEGLNWINSMFFFETRIGRGTGILHLTQNDAGEWKAYSMYTTLQELKSFEEPLGARRADGTIESMPGGLSQGNWIERRQRLIEFKEEEPTALVVGAGQAGLNMAARLQSLGVSHLIVDRNERIGDNWRKRYRTLVTHDPAEFTHMAYLPFPKNWPQYTPKDKLGDWFEAYASIMELNVWLQTSVKSAEYDDATKQWTVTVVRGDGSERILHPRHLIWCTGHSGEPLVPSFQGQSNFKGTIYHGSQHDDASRQDAAGKKVVVVGTGNSGHDIAQNFYENGAQVTMLQRRGTYVITVEKGVIMMHEGQHDENGPPTEEADLMHECLPYPVQFALSVHFTKRVALAEQDILSGLERAGFALDFGIDGAGIARAYMTRGGGYYIDVGCSPLIASGKIKVKQSPEGISHFTESGLVLKDGSTLPADIVVLATGYDNMRTTVRKVLGDRVADRCQDVWDLDEEGEINAMWRPSGHPGFWYMGGNLALCRIYSKFLALQIKAIEAGLVDADQTQAQPKL
ncbi:putative flavin-binding monooxygenase [Aspergillus ibericus CBS 121593]|uniref:Flavin-containing monooxygenase n=1 Tax=Aspergillus ibericus CBS 121593 TaxID=1448316 RepID=A0A395GNL6_9EURO|nr:flavin-containing monooxygenase [Aspergillus ibericus CBS 121593]RAK97101.1 flavin-containing monooxygenase [Aspergillus ibericus CBS 121593]